MKKREALERAFEARGEAFTKSYAQDQNRVNAVDAGHSAFLASLKEDGWTLARVEVIDIAACDIEAATKAEYGWPNIHPAMQRKYERDMQIVADLRAMLAAQEDE